MSDTDLSKSRVINVNDFIFKQNLEFYPNLQGLTCEDNTLKFMGNKGPISEVLTLDLRTLPGNVWQVDPEKFIEIIKINKACKSLYDFINVLNQGNIAIDPTLENNIKSFMNLYFTAKDNSSFLTEDNKILLGNIEVNIARLPKELPLGNLVNKELDAYFEQTKEMGDTKGKGMVLELKNKNLPMTMAPEEPKRSSRAAFINSAILLYGILNIGIILAIAFMK